MANSAHRSGEILPKGNSASRMAVFETTSRLLTSLVNEKLVKAVVVVDHDRLEHGQALQICSYRKRGLDSDVSIFVGLDVDVAYDPLNMSLVSLLDPSDLLPPVAILPVSMRNRVVAMHKVEREENPGVLFDLMFPWFGTDEASRKQIIRELNNSARNQEEWFRLASDCSLGSSSLKIGSPLIDWERAVLRGHPTHPMHRTCLAQPPLEPLEPGDLHSVLTPEILFLSVRRTDIIAIGPFEDRLKPLLEELRISTASISPDNIVIPCLARQLPSIRLRLNDKVTILSTKKLHAKSQASIRTVSLSPRMTFGYDLKFAFACNISSALRTVTPWTASVGPELSILLPKVLPPTMWVVGEIAAVTGSQSEFDVAKHVSVLIRENLEFRAHSQGQCLIVASALAESGVTGDLCHAERVFELTNLERKKDWLREYASMLIQCTLMPVLQHGVCLEAHGQNVLVRFEKPTRRLVGFAIRDFGGLKLHMPTLRQHGYDVRTSPPGSLITVDDLAEVYDLAHHSIFNTHLRHLIRSLRLHRSGGWAIVREELAKVLRPEESTTAKDLFTFLMREKIPVKCFIRMKMQGLYRDYIHQDAPNVLLS